jgi:nucleotide-binding universal stress UspA family protein
MGARNIGVAVDFSSCSKAALRWASTNLARNGDKIILFHVNNSYQNEQGAVHLWEQSGSREHTYLLRSVLHLELEYLNLAS